MCDVHWVNSSLALLSPNNCVSAFHKVVHFQRDSPEGYEELLIACISLAVNGSLSQTLTSVHTVQPSTQTSS